MAASGNKNNNANNARKHHLGSARRGILFYVLWAVALAAFGLVAGYLMAPDALVRTVGRWIDGPLTVESLSMDIGSGSGKGAMLVKPGEKITVNPGKAISITGLKSSRWRNYDLRLYCADFDISNIISPAPGRSLISLMGEEAFNTPRDIVIEVKDNGGNTSAASFILSAGYSSFDWETKGDGEKDASKRAEFYKKSLTLEPESSSIREKLYKTLISAGRQSELAEFLEADLQKEPNLDKYKDLFDIYKRQGNAGKQIDLLVKMIALTEKQGGSADQLNISLADLYRRHGQAAKAAEIIDVLAKNTSGQAAEKYLYDLVTLYRAANQPEKEIEIWRQLLVLASPDKAPGIWSEIIKLSEKTGNQALRLEAWQALADSLPAGQKKANAFKTLGLMLVKAEKLDEARAAYLNALNFDSQDPTLLLNLAHLAFNQSDEAAYRDYLEKYLALSPDDLEKRLSFAQSLEKARLEPEAQEQYRQILAKEPRHQAASIALIGLLKKNDDKQPLINEYERLIVLNPDDKVAAYNAGVLYFQEKMWAKSAAHFETVVKLDQADAGAHGYLVAVYQELDRPKDAAAQAALVYKLDPGREEYLPIAAAIYEDAGDWAGLKALAEDLAKAHPSDPEVKELLRKAKTALGDKNGAAQIQPTPVGEEDADTIEGLFKTSLAFEADEEWEKALDTYRKILELEPRNEQAGEAELVIKLKIAGEKNNQ